MILKLILLGALVASQGAGSAIKSRADQQQQLKIDQLVDVKQETLSNGEELTRKTGPLRNEARPQLSRDDLAKGQQREEPLPEQAAEQERVELEGQQVEQRDELQQVAVGQAPLPLPLPAPAEQLPRVEELAAVKGAPEAVLVPAAEPYAFGYRVEGSSRTESGDTRGVVRGQYTLEGADGSSRVVDYVADHNGFRASVRTNEFGTEARSPAHVALLSAQPPAEEITRRLEVPRLSVVPVPVVQAGGQRLELPPPLLVREAVEPAAKGLRSEESQQQQQRDLVEPPAPKSPPADRQKAPRALQPSAPLKVASTETRAHFESATAHRVTPVRRPVVTARSFVRRERYPPSPAQGVYRRHQVGVDPRVSFYAPPTMDDLDLVSFAEQK